MAKVEIIRYQCDVCKEEFKNSLDVKETFIPCFGGERNEYHEEVRVDLCKKCAYNLRNIIYCHFAEINNYYGIHIKNKQNNDVGKDHR